MKITQFDRSTVKSLKSEIDLALASLSKKYGISISTGNASFTGNNVTFKVQAATESNGMVMTQEATDFNRYAPVFLKGFELGETVAIMGKLYTLTGWKPRSKNCVVVSLNGKSYKVSLELIYSYNKRK